MTDLEQQAREVLERAQAAWKRFFYPENSDFVKSCGCLNPTGVPLQVADSLREVLNVVSGRDLTADPTHVASLAFRAAQPGEVDLAGIGPFYLSEDGLSLVTPLDGDVDGEGRHIVVGGDLLATFEDSDAGEILRDFLLAALAKPRPDRDAVALDDRTIGTELREAANLLDGSGDFDLRDACREDASRLERNPLPAEPVQEMREGFFAQDANKSSEDGWREERAIADIAAERRAHGEREGWTVAHDDEHGDGSLAAAAATYAFAAATEGRYFAADPLGFWPWDASWWKPAGARRNLVKAGSLIVAEIERIDRAALSETQEQESPG